MIVMCGYLTPELLAIPGNIPAACGMCRQQIVISGMGAAMLAEEGSKAVCPTCVFLNAPDDMPMLPPGRGDARALFEGMGLAADLLDAVETASIKDAAEKLREQYHGTVMN